MKISTSRKQDAQVKREKAFELVLKHKLARLDNDAIARELYKEGIGVEEGGELVRPYSTKYVSSLVREALKQVAAERSEYGQSVQVQLDHDLETLVQYWMPRALGEAVDENGEVLQPSIKAAELVRKLTADRAVLTGANEAKRLEVSIQLESTLDQFISTLRQLMPEDHFESVIKAISAAEEMNSAYWREQKQLQSGDSDIIDADIVG
jgi:hypothetical protein